MANAGCGGSSRLSSPQEKVTSFAWGLLAPALGDDLTLIQHEVEIGRSLLMAWGGEFFTVLREEASAKGRELVIVAAAGKNSLPYLQEIKQIAKRDGFASIRLHTLKPDPMLRMSERADLGFERAETILRTVL